MASPRPSRVTTVITLASRVTNSENPRSTIAAPSMVVIAVRVGRPAAMTPPKTMINSTRVNGRENSSALRRSF